MAYEETIANFGSVIKQLGLTEAQQKRLWSYRKDIIHDSDKILYDGPCIDVIEKYLKPGMTPFLKQTIGYLDNIEYNQSKKRYELARIQVKEHFGAEQAADFRWNKNFKRALGIMQDEVADVSLTTKVFNSDQEFGELLRKPHANAGFKAIESGFKAKSENLDGILDDYRGRIKKAKQTGSFNIPLLIGFRTQSSDFWGLDGKLKKDGEKSKIKTRTIMMSSMVFQVLEEQWMNPADEVLHRLPWFTPGKSEDDIHKIIYDAIDNRYFTHWFSADFSRYDSTIPSWMIETVYKDFIRPMFKEDNFDDQLFNIMVHDLIHKDIILDDGITHVDHGNGSGFRSTTCTSTCCTRIAYLTYFNKLGWEEGKDFIMMACGDDSLIFSREPINSDDIASYFKHNFGFICDPKKCSSGSVFEGEYPKYLSRVWKRTGEWRDPLEIIGKLAFPERFRDHKITPPEVVIYAYCLAFPLGMREIINVGKFLKDNPCLKADIHEIIRQGQQKVLPGSMQYFIQYEGYKLREWVAA